MFFLTLPNRVPSKVIDYICAFSGLHTRPAACGVAEEVDAEDDFDDDRADPEERGEGEPFHDGDYIVFVHFAQCRGDGMRCRPRSLAEG